MASSIKTKDRPKIKLKMQTADRVIEVLAWIVLLAMWVFTFKIYPQLPEIVPTHFNIKGDVDGYGSKNTLLLLPAIGTVLFFGFTVLSRFPHIYNYPIVITTKNAEGQYRNGARLMRLLKLSLISVFVITLYQTQTVVEGKDIGLEKWSLMLDFGLIMIPIIYFLVRSFRLSK